MDNTPAEAALIRGYSTKGDTADIVASAQLIAAHMDARIWYFHVDSDSNPSDGLSRDGLQDTWTVDMATARGWRLRSADLPKCFDEIAGLPLSLITRRFSPMAASFG